MGYKLKKYKNLDLSKYEKMYDNVDAGHDMTHIEQVRERAISLGKKYLPSKLDELYIAATLHDIGLTISRKDHEENGAKLVAKDKELARIVGQENMADIINSIASHRYSTGTPTDTFGKIIYDADKTGVTAQQSVCRACIYNAAKYPKTDIYILLTMALKHQSGKYGNILTEDKLHFKESKAIIKRNVNSFKKWYKMPIAEAYKLIIDKDCLQKINDTKAKALKEKVASVESHMESFHKHFHTIGNVLDLSNNDLEELDLQYDELDKMIDTVYTLCHLHDCIEADGATEELKDQVIEKLQDIDIAYEGIGDIAKSVKDAIVAGIKKAVDWIVSKWHKLLELLGLRKKKKEKTSGLPETNEEWEAVWKYIETHDVLVRSPYKTFTEAHEAIKKSMSIMEKQAVAYISVFKDPSKPLPEELAMFKKETLAIPAKDFYKNVNILKSSISIDILKDMPNVRKLFSLLENEYSAGCSFGQFQQQAGSAYKNASKTLLKAIRQAQGFIDNVNNIDSLVNTAANVVTYNRTKNEKNVARIHGLNPEYFNKYIKPDLKNPQKLRTAILSIMSYERMIKESVCIPLAKWADSELKKNTGKSIFSEPTEQNKKHLQKLLDEKPHTPRTFSMYLVVLQDGFGLTELNMLRKILLELRAKKVVEYQVSTNNITKRVFGI